MTNVGRRWPELGWLSILFVVTVVVTGTAFVLGRGARVPAADIYLLYVTRIWLLAPALLAIGAVNASIILLVQGRNKPLKAFRAYWKDRLSSRGDLAACFGPLLLLEVCA